MAVVPHSTYLVAGINESEKTTKTGKNKHFRTFKIDKVESKEKDAPDAITITSSGSEQFFEPENWADLFQHNVVCSSRGKVAAAIRSAPMKKGERDYGGELVLVDLADPTHPKNLMHIQMEGETTSVDVIPSDKDGEDDIEHYVVSTNISFFVRHHIPSAPTDAVTRFDIKRFIEQGTAIKAIKYLTPNIVLILLNLANQGGCQFLVIFFPMSQPTTLLSSHYLHRGIKRATSMDIVQLTPLNNKTSRQTVIAVSGADTSIELVLLDIDFQPGGRHPTEAYWQSYKTLKNVHIIPASKVAFAPFPTKHNTHLRLASVSPANTVTVHTIPLSDSAHLRRRSTGLFGTATTLVITLFSLTFIVLLAIMLQLLFNARGDLPAATEKLGSLFGVGNNNNDNGNNYYHHEDKKIKSLMTTDVPDVADIVAATDNDVVVDDDLDAVETDTFTSTTTMTRTIIKTRAKEDEGEAAAHPTQHHGTLDRMKEKLGGLEEDMKLVQGGVKDSFKKEFVQGIVEGVLDAAR